MVDRTPEIRGVRSDRLCRRLRLGHLRDGCGSLLRSPTMVAGRLRNHPRNHRFFRTSATIATIAQPGFDGPFLIRGGAPVWTDKGSVVVFRGRCG